MANEEQLKILKQGVEVWNEWREEHPDEKINLRGANLKGKNLSGADFHGADIRGTSFQNAILVGANFSKTIAGLAYTAVIVHIIVSLFLGGLSASLTTMGGIFAGGIVQVVGMKVFIIVSFLLFSVVIVVIQKGWVTAVIVAGALVMVVAEVMLMGPTVFVVMAVGAVGGLAGSWLQVSLRLLWRRRRRLWL